MRNLENRFCLNRRNFRRRMVINGLMVILLTLASVRLVQASDPEIYFFTSAGCPPCRQVEPILERLTYQGHRITKIDVRQYPSWVQRFQIQTTPTIVVVKDNQVVKRHSGLIDRSTVLSWLESASSSQSGAVLPSGLTSQNVSTLSADGSRANPERASGPESDTMHRGTRNPGNEMERLAMDATVRLRVEDEEGFSFATGTVIHSHEGEWLVLTCGHVFRESNGNGIITAEYDFYKNKRRVPGQLLTFDAGPRDVALVTVKAGHNIKPVALASRHSPVRQNATIFSIGCDKGDDPTIRRSRIKNQAKYDGVLKYEIFGRPVIGRSGGGLFNEQGELVGVCNAAAVDYDEGIYSSLTNIHHMIAKVDLQGLFQKNGAGVVRLAKTEVNPNVRPNEVSLLPKWQSAPELDAPRLPRANEPMRASLIPTNPTFKQTPPRQDRWASTSPRSGFDQTPRQTRVSHQVPDRQISADDMEVLVIVRSKSKPSLEETIRLPNPSPELRSYLESISGKSPPQRLERSQMPVVAPPSRRGVDMRAQSPR